MSAPVTLWVVSLFDHRDSSTQAWVMLSEDLVIPTLKNGYAGELEVGDLPDDLDELEVALKTDGYTLFVEQQEVEL